jgi:thioredoxin-like negative regulator of GroEL
MLAATLEDIRNDWKDGMPPVEVIDIDVHPELAQEYGIRSVPTLVMLDENIETRRQVGAMQKSKLMEWIRGYA